MCYGASQGGAGGCGVCIELELNKQIHLPSEAYLFLLSYRTSISVEGMQNYFIPKLSRDDSRDKVSADELNGLHRSLIQEAPLYGSANNPRNANDPRPQMIPKLDRK